MRSLWDSDVVSEFIRARNAIVRKRGLDYLNRYYKADISLFTRYEVRRGYLAKRASRLLVLFEMFCQNNVVHELDDPVIDRASELWADLRRAGQSIGDGDPILAATALHYGLGIATRNAAHFTRIPGLVVEDWSQP
jgi:tRNA(fMet)-specific endonuclease VapC